ncbi:hypothetical protein CDL15_Pgr011582 [Punica granatum]|uniref:Uncharacterized protein n=1 Tax=Punica granatum TaxID=22663 RepID=A0A218Y2Q2_PUNGR|nr:hypothetical protein CDL15_Pgr011582 [Punica granatum]PKI44081.1 hypothetical protein CRG98_035543 [Punica granatum]
MGTAIFVSLPMMLLLVLVSIGCYHYGKRKGIEEGRLMAAQELGVQLPPPGPSLSMPLGVVAPPPAPVVPPPQPYFPSPSNFNANPPPPYLKQHQSVNQ